MSVCPVPPSSSKTDYTATNNSTFTPSPPTRTSNNSCGYSANISTSQPPTYTGSGLILIDNGTELGPITRLDITGVGIKAYLPSPSSGEIRGSATGGSITLKDNGNTLGDVNTLDITGSGIRAYVSGLNGTIDGSGMVWRGIWTAATPYIINDTVKEPTSGDVFVCTADHTSGGTPPTAESHTNWDIVVDGALITQDVNGLPQGDLSLWDTLKNGVFDWFNNMTAGDWFKLLLTGAGIIYTGVKLLDTMNNDGSSNGTGTPADSRFNGTNGTLYSAYTAPNLQTLVGSLLTFSGISSYDVSLLPTTSVEFIISSQITVRNILQSLSLVYQFDIIPSGGTVKCIPRNNSVARVLTTDDIGHMDHTDGLNSTTHYTARRQQGIDLPRSVTVTYISKSLNYNTFTQTATLETYTEGQDIQINIPFVLSDSSARAVAEYALVNAHMERQEYTFTTDYYHLDLEPGDVITIPLDIGITTNIRIISINETTDGLLEITGVRSDYNSHTYAVSGVTITAPPSQTNVINDIGYSQAMYLEVPPLNSGDTTPRLYAAIHGYGRAGWPGANLYRSVDGGANYSYELTSYGTPTLGQVTGTVPTGTTSGFDTSTTITVTLKQGTLISSTDSAVQNGENRCMVGQEMIGFVNATLTAPNTYQLTRLLRGQQGTDYHVGTHQSGELFVLINDQLTVIEIPKNEIGKTYKYKCVTIGSDISKVTSEDISSYACNLRPWQLLTKSAVKQPNGDWLITWTERPKFSASVRDFSQIQHDFDWGGFGVTILGPGDIEKRKQLTGESQFLYTVAMQTTDFGSAQTTLKVTLTQFSTIVGAGYPVTFTA